MTITERKQEVTEYTLSTLIDLKDYYTGYGSDLHNEIYNTSYYIIGTYKAKEWLEGDVFEIIGIVKDYEIDNYGELITDISNPEKLVNMYVYILGEEILCKSDHLNEECFDSHLTSDDIEKIIVNLAQNRI